MNEDFEILLYNGAQDSFLLANKFNVAFPHRGAEFFLSAIDNLNPLYSCLCVLKLNDAVVGGVFLYKIYGYPESVWSPSYLFVDKIARGLSLIFFVNSLFKKSRSFLDVSPTDEVKALLAGLKSKPINNGSLLIPLLIHRFLPYKLRHCSRSSNCLENSSSPFERFNGRSDLIWYRFSQDDVTELLCIKKTSRLGVPLFILVYFQLNCLSLALPSLIKELSKINIFASLVVPNLNTYQPFFSIKTSKLHSFSNFDLGQTYSVLGSEITEIV